MEPQLAAPDGVVYDDDAHTYRLDGRLVPSVSALLKVINPDEYAGICADVMAKASARGSRRHDMIALDVRGQLDVGNLPDDDVGSYIAWQQFCEDYKFRASLSERIVCSREHKFCGTLDLGGTLVYKGTTEDWLVDIKFTAMLPVLVDPQTEAYRMAAVESLGWSPKTRRGCLWIRNDKYQFVELTDKASRALIVSARSIYHWRETHDRNH